MSFSKSDINLDVQKETDKIVNQLKDDVFHKLKIRGAVRHQDYNIILPRFEIDGFVKSRKTPSPSMGEGWGEGE